MRPARLEKHLLSFYFPKYSYWRGLEPGALENQGIVFIEEVASNDKPTLSY